MSPIVRVATLEDAKAISELAITTFPMACPVSTPAEDVKSYIESNLNVGCFEIILQSSEKRLHVLELDGRIIGYSMLSLAPEPVGIAKADGIIELTRCYILAEYHGVGFAQQLVSETLKSVDKKRRVCQSRSSSAAEVVWPAPDYRRLGQRLLSRQGITGLSFLSGTHMTGVFFTHVLSQVTITVSSTHPGAKQ